MLRLDALLAGPMMVRAAGPPERSVRSITPTYVPLFMLDGAAAAACRQPGPAAGGTLVYVPLRPQQPRAQPEPIKTLKATEQGWSEGWSLCRC